jgi:hypothetical protein
VERHVTVLGLLTSLWGALAMLVGVALLFLSAGALAVLAGPDGDTVGFAAGLTAGTFAALGVFALIWGGSHVWAGMLLRRHQAAGRFLTLALAVVDLLVLPFGTALGIYALWVLLNHDVRRLFEPVAPANTLG